MVSMDGGAKSTRSAGSIMIDLATEYPLIDHFDKYKLPNYKEIIGMVMRLNQIKTYNDSIKDVSNIVWKHWTDRNVYPKTLKIVKKKVSEVVKKYKEIKNTHENKRTQRWRDKAKDFIRNKEKLFDIFCEDRVSLGKLEKLNKIPMQDEDFQYLESMRTDRKAKCESRTDKVWHDKEKKRLEKREHYLQTQSSTIITAVSVEDDESSSNGDNTEEYQLTVEDSDNSPRKRAKASDATGRKKSRYLDIIENEADELPYHVRHIRNSERIVRDEVYWTMANLDGHNFSYKDSQIAIMVVGNVLFGRKWKLPSVEHSEEGDQESTFDADTLPTARNIREMLNKVEALSLKQVGDRVIEADSEGATITHATDATTRKVVGTFAPAGVHINKDEYLPFPTLPLSSETTQNIAQSIEVDFKLIGAASGHSAEILYKTVDVHMTDATAHNKGVSKILAETFNREYPAGQIFCDSHTVLGFDRCMVKVINSVEETMGMQNIFNSFMVDVEIDQQKDTVAISTVSWTLSLFGPDKSSKPWNYYKDFSTFINRDERHVHLFSLKDARFGELSKSSAIMCYHWNDFCSFLESHSYITNKLACLVRDALKLDYVKVVVAVVAALGVHLVSPYHAMTIHKDATHSSLQVFFKTLYSDLINHEVDGDFFKFDAPEFHSVSQQLFDNVKKEYKMDVLNSVGEMARSHLDECITLANKMIPQIGDVLAMQRGKYYDFGEYPREYHVFDQCDNIDNTPVHNLQMERQCGDTDHRLKKKSSLNVVTRGTILKNTASLRGSVPTSEFRKMGPIVKILTKIKFQWSERQKELQTYGLTKKEADLLKIENRKLNILDKLNSQGGPFTSDEQVQKYLDNSKDSTKEKLSRMKDEVTYARDTCSSLPKSNPIFRIRKTQGTTRRMLTSEEFGNNLKALLGKTKQRHSVTLEDFRAALLS